MTKMPVTASIFDFTVLLFFNQFYFLIVFKEPLQ